MGKRKKGMCEPVPVLQGKHISSPLSPYVQRLVSVIAPKEFKVVTQTQAHTPCVRFFQGAGVGR